ncbi:CPBP family intramembrane glutamic endopeptidase [Parerythrobacter aurantius]|uniref:CPBP family glutamic-type intramembrane protease n=1 Tax=Parerythrobacter aurantius TaxID=3127706 RepID=UPI0032440B26
MKDDLNLSTAPQVQLAAPSLRQEWSAYAAFLRRPVLPPAASGLNRAGGLALLRLYLLDLLLAGSLVAIGLLAIGAGFAPPDHSLAQFDWGPGTVLLIVLGAPLMEELAFRGWLSGRPGAVLGIALLLVAAATLLLAGREGAPDTLVPVAFAALAALAGLAAAVLLRRRAPWNWFARIFPLFFWISTLAFALVHLSNYQEGSLTSSLPLVIPQFIAGSIFAYARVTHGLWASVVLHALHNGTLAAIIGLALAASG